MKSLFCAVGAALIALVLVTGSAKASVVIAGTRVVFPAASGEVTVRLSNEGTRPALVEAWIDDGAPTSTPDTAKVPFLVSPPLARMNPGKGQSLRIVYTGQPLPADRESLFWLNVLEIPPKPRPQDGEPQNTLQFAVRSRLKLFFRPAGLPGDLATAAQQVTWRVDAEGAGYVLVVGNPSPYHVTFSKVALETGTPQPAGNGMVAPRSSLRLPLPGLKRPPPPGTTVRYTIINDFGAAASYKGMIAS